MHRLATRFELFPWLPSQPSGRDKVAHPINIVAGMAKARRWPTSKVSSYSQAQRLLTPDGLAAV
ncbi:MAG: hypothetical protein B7X59_12885 [Polaromonas sp. 39-63-203]|nr:MAG: hypothetical protein B7Y03_13415 [Polaromonas sp. 24-62-144]OZA94943.1 MAG: hypothetical protein B7X59_12885 [Polaromonas sp. 39-63-203]